MRGKGQKGRITRPERVPKIGLPQRQTSELMVQVAACTAIDPDLVEL